MGKNPTAPPRMYNVKHRHRQLVTIHIMRGRVPHRGSGFQSLVGARSWNIGAWYGIGGDGQECSWGGRCLASCVRCEAGLVGRGVDFLLKGATGSIPSLPSIHPCSKPCAFSQETCPRYSPEPQNLSHTSVCPEDASRIDRNPFPLPPYQKIFQTISLLM